MVASASLSPSIWSSLSERALHLCTWPRRRSRRPQESVRTCRTVLDVASSVSLRLLSVAAIFTAAGCGGKGSGTTNADGGSDGGGDSSAPLESPLCRRPYPAQACDGDPHGQWTLAAMCVNGYQDCPGAMVTTTGTAAA